MDVQKDVEPEELDEGMETDNVQMDMEEHVIGEVREGAVNNVQKSQPSEENETEENEKDNNLDNVQNSTSDQNQAEDNKRDKPLENEQSINDAHEITKEKTGQDEEQNANADDMQVEQQSGNDDSQEDRKDNKVKDDQKGDIQEQMEANNVQKDSEKPKRWISPHSTNTGEVASRLLRNARSKIKGSWEFVNKQRAERAKATKCFVCGKQNKTLQELEFHVRRKHKSYRYKCTYCRKKYLTRAGRNKHEMYHTIGYRYKCKKCKKCFMFESQYDEHMSVQGITGTFAERKDARKIMVALMQEIITKGNMQPALYCDFHENPKAKKCNQEFFSKQHLNQHYRGAHGEGWHAKCGKHFSWPAQRTVHEKDCTECGKIKKQEAKKKWQKKK